MKEDFDNKEKKTIGIIFGVLFLIFFIGTYVAYLFLKKIKEPNNEAKPSFLYRHIKQIAQDFGIQALTELEEEEESNIPIKSYQMLKKDNDELKKQVVELEKQRNNPTNAIVSELIKKNTKFREHNKSLMGINNKLKQEQQSSKEKYKSRLSKDMDEYKQRYNSEINAYKQESERNKAQIKKSEDLQRQYKELENKHNLLKSNKFKEYENEENERLRNENALLRNENQKNFMYKKLLVKKKS